LIFLLSPIICLVVNIKAMTSGTFQG